MGCVAVLNWVGARNVPSPLFSRMLTLLVLALAVKMSRSPSPSTSPMRRHSGLVPAPVV